jgi:hypothetical protein
MLYLSPDSAIKRVMSANRSDREAFKKIASIYPSYDFQLIAAFTCKCAQSADDEKRLLLL